MRSYTPTKRFFALQGLLALLAIGCLMWDWFALIWLILQLALSILLMIDWLAMRQCRMTLASHDFSHQPTVQNPFTLRMMFMAEIPPKVRFSIHAVQSNQLRLERPAARVEMREDETLGTQISACWVVTPRERGNLEWPGTLVSFITPFSLLRGWQTFPAIAFRVYPKLNMSLQTLLAPKVLMEQLGIKTNRFKRADQAFESLRPYAVGDNYRHIDWKASARSNHLITRQFEMEHHHNILVCIDSSRLMGTMTEGISKLDWAIEASLHLAYLANYLKDNIGLMVFSNSVDLMVKPKKSPVDSFLAHLYDTRAKVVEADFNQVCMQILATQKKRSLVIFLSDFIDMSSMQAYMPSFGHLNRKHCSLFVGIEDPAYKRHLDDHIIPTDAHGFALLLRILWNVGKTF
jgi:uncharacterized protein (DUF58 family)